jgi:FkbM family methyltransferase
MEPDSVLLSKPKYVDLLGEAGARNILRLFSEIERGKYDKAETHEIKIQGIKYPLTIRAIRADMQSFINTFIDPYFEPKPYLSDSRYVIDAGANIGYTAALFANWWPGCSIISIEADKENFDVACKNLAPYKNVNVLHGGLWNKESNLRIEAGQEDGFVVREVSSASKSTSTQNLTRGFALQALLDRYHFPEIDFLKMNVEGSEKEIFSLNYESWISKTKAMLIELHDGKNAGCSKAVFSTVGKYDFAVAETAPFGVLFVKEGIYRKWYADWYREKIYKPNIDKDRFPEFYLDNERKTEDK